MLAHSHERFSSEIALTPKIVRDYALAVGDTNPVHLDDDYAKTTPFKARIAHGMLSAAYISAVLGTRLPGPGAIYLNQALRFRRPVPDVWLRADQLEAF